VCGALGGAAAVLVVDDALPPAGAIPATGSFARQAIPLAGSGPGGGFGSVSLQIPDDAAGYGRVLFGRWYVSDPGAAGGVAASPPFVFRIFGPHGAGAAVPLSVGGAPRDPRRFDSAPNPFATATTVRFDLARASRVRLAVFDMSGRRVRRLFERPLAMPGAYAVVWDGRDDQRREVAAGVYCCRLETDRESRAVRIVRVR
jgi:hypothetical protein